MKDNIIEISLTSTENVYGSSCNCMCRDTPTVYFSSLKDTTIKTMVGDGFPVIYDKNKHIRVVGKVVSDDACKEACAWMGYKESFCSPLGVTVREY